MSPHSTSRSSTLRRAVARWGISLVSVVVLAGIAVEVVGTEPPEGGDYCSTAAQDVRRADLAFERGSLPTVMVADRRCQR
ncbi:hypothetical protein [Promicromonospora sukumoe]